jgi:hypothetical protein
MKSLSLEFGESLTELGQIDFHPDVELNLQFNRYCVDEDMIETIHQVAGRVKNVQDWHREMESLAEAAAAAGNSYRVLRLTEASQFYLAPEVDRSDYLATIGQACANPGPALISNLTQSTSPALRYGSSAFPRPTGKPLC